MFQLTTNIVSVPLPGMSNKHVAAIHHPPSTMKSNTNLLHKSKNGKKSVGITEIIELSLLCDEVTDEQWKRIQKKISFVCCIYSPRQIATILIGYFLYQLRHKEHPTHYVAFNELVRNTISSNTMQIMHNPPCFSNASPDVVTHIMQYLNLNEIFQVATISRAYYLIIVKSMALEKMEVHNNFPISVLRFNEVTSLAIKMKLLVASFRKHKVQVCSFAHIFFNIFHNVLLRCRH